MKKNEITIHLKLFSGLHREITLEGFDPYKGLQLSVKKGTRLKSLLRSIGMKNLSSNMYFMNGERVGLWQKLNDGVEIQCFRPSAGG